MPDAREIIREFHTLDSLKLEIYVNNVENSFPTRQRLRRVSVTRIKWLALFRVICLIAVYSQNYTKHNNRPRLYVRNQWRR
jgi:hypothetical protein